MDFFFLCCPWLQERLSFLDPVFVLLLSLVACYYLHDYKTVYVTTVSCK